MAVKLNPLDCALPDGGLNEKPALVACEAWLATSPNPPAAGLAPNEKGDAAAVDVVVVVGAGADVFAVPNWNSEADG